MNKWIIACQLSPVLAALAALFIGHPVSCQQLQREQLTFVVTEELARPPQQRVPLGNQPVETHAADYNPGFAQRLLVPLMRGSITLSDVDGKKEPYLYVAGTGRSPMLWQGSPGGKLHEITSPVPALGLAGSLAAAFADYDHSGRQSLFLVGTEGVTLYRNIGNNSFSDVTRKAGLHNTPGVLCTSAVLGDLDGDQFPDLLVAAYTNLNRPPSKSTFTFPNDFPGVTSRLYRNNRNGTFTDVTESSGLGDNPGRSRKAILADFNNDQRLDILLLRDNKPPVFYLNRGGWKFEDATWQAGDDLTTHAFFEAAVTDLNGDGNTDLALWSTHSFRLLLNEGNATFKRTAVRELPEPAIGLFGFRGALADLDGNGRLDDVLTVDKEGRLCAFINSSGAFRKVSLALPPGFEAGYLTPLRVRDSRKTYLLAIPSGGAVVLLEKKTSSPPLALSR